MSDVAPRATHSQVIARAHGEGRLLLTEDRDFGDLVHNQNPSRVLCLQIDSSRPQGFDATRRVWRYFVLVAALVVPILLIVRLVRAVERL
jgi:hypothetical protein